MQIPALPLHFVRRSQLISPRVPRTRSSLAGVVLRRCYGAMLWCYGRWSRTRRSARSQRSRAQPPGCEINSVWRRRRRRCLEGGSWCRGLRVRGVRALAGHVTTGCARWQVT
eukprot:2899951-Rhodomonas_salina.1